MTDPMTPTEHNEHSPEGEKYNRDMARFRDPQAWSAGATPERGKAPLWPKPALAPTDEKWPDAHPVRERAAKDLEESAPTPEVEKMAEEITDAVQWVYIEQDSPSRSPTHKQIRTPIAAILARAFAEKDAEIARLRKVKESYQTRANEHAACAEKAEAELAKIHATLQVGLDRDKDDSSTLHLATIAVNGLAMRDRIRAEVEAQAELPAEVREAIAKALYGTPHAELFTEGQDAVADVLTAIAPHWPKQPATPPMPEEVQAAVERLSEVATYDMTISFHRQDLADLRTVLTALRHQHQCLERLHPYGREEIAELQAKLAEAQSALRFASGLLEEYGTPGAEMFREECRAAIDAARAKEARR